MSDIWETRRQCCVAQHACRLTGGLARCRGSTTTGRCSSCTVQPCGGVSLASAVPTATHSSMAVICARQPLNSPFGRVSIRTVGQILNGIAGPVLIAAPVRAALERSGSLSFPSRIALRLNDPVWRPLARAVPPLRSLVQAWTAHHGHGRGERQLRRGGNRLRALPGRSGRAAGQRAEAAAAYPRPRRPPAGRGAPTTANVEGGTAKRAT
jgi:hypothetical protein